MREKGEFRVVIRKFGNWLLLRAVRSISKFNCWIKYFINASFLVWKQELGDTELRNLSSDNKTTRKGRALLRRSNVYPAKLLLCSEAQSSFP